MTIWFLIALIAHVLGFLSPIAAVMSTRTSQGAIAWVTCLNTCPYVAVPAYWVLGRSRFRGYVTARRSEDVEVQKKLAKLLKRFDPFRVPKSEISPAALAAEGMADLPSLRGSRIQLLIDGDATFDSILEGIGAAEEYILALPGLAGYFLLMNAP